MIFHNCLILPDHDCIHPRVKVGSEVFLHQRRQSGGVPKTKQALKHHEATTTSMGENGRETSMTQGISVGHDGFLWFYDGLMGEFSILKFEILVFDIVFTVPRFRRPCALRIRNACGGFMHAACGDGKSADGGSTKTHPGSLLFTEKMRWILIPAWSHGFQRSTWIRSNKIRYNHRSSLISHILIPLVRCAFIVELLYRTM